DDIKRLSPSLSFSVQPWREEMLFVRGMYKSTFRVPSFNDLYYDRLGSRTLRPEKADEYDIGITWSKSLFPAMDYLSLTVDGYINNVRDKIVAFPSTYVWRMANYGKVRINGLDVTLATAFSLPYDMSISMSAAYTFQKAIDLTDPTSKSYKDQLPYTPVHSGNAALTFKTPYVTVGYSLVGVGKRYYLAQNIPVNEIAGYVEQNLTLSREFQFRNVNFAIRGELINIADKQYDVIKYYPMPGRSWRVVANVKF
ncbi:MAG: TonB-dependent receptor, partial [Duncaniella sp.]|nr:TonB-dependent receptor [Duncaniella sp.]